MKRDENFYYEAPTDEIFTNVKEVAVNVWKSYDDTYGYATEKLNRIKDLKNIRDNFMFLVAMFDMENQTILSRMISSEAKAAICSRMVAGGTPAEFNVFMHPIERIQAILSNPEVEAPFTMAIKEHQEKEHQHVS